MVIFYFFKMAAAAIFDVRNLKIITVGTVKRAKLRHRAKFHADQSNRCGGMTIFYFSKWRPHQRGLLDFWNFNSRETQKGQAASLCQILSKSVKLRPRYGDFSIFQDGGRRHVGFLKFQISNDRKDPKSRTAPLCQISSKSVKPRPRYGHFSIFQDGGRRHVGFLNFWNFNGRNAQDGRTASPFQILSKSVETRPRYSDFSIFQDGRRPPSWICYVCVRTTYEGYLVVFIAVQNLVGIDAVVLILL